MRQVALLKSRLQNRGGLEKHTLQLAQAFANKGCMVTLLTSGPTFFLPNVKVVSLTQNSKCTLFHLLKFDRACRQWLTQNPHQIIFGMERTSFQTHYRAGNGVHKEFLINRALTESLWKTFSFKINPLHRYLLKQERKIFENPLLKCLFVNSHIVRKQVSQHFHIPQEKITVIHNGVEWKEWEQDFESSLLQPRKQDYQFLFVGNGYRRKGLTFLLDGLAEFKKIRWRLTVVGKDCERNFFENKVAKLGLKDKVYFAGPQRDIKSFYSNADALILPSIYDPFANVTVEALTMGVFVVTSTYNGGHEILTPNSGIILDNLKSKEQMILAIKNCFSRPKTSTQARTIRQSVKDLDFSIQLDKIVEHTLTSMD